LPRLATHANKPNSPLIMATVGGIRRATQKDAGVWAQREVDAQHPWEAHVTAVIIRLDQEIFRRRANLNGAANRLDRRLAASQRGIGYGLDNDVTPATSPAGLLPSGPPRRPPHRRPRLAERPCKGSNSKASHPHPGIMLARHRTVSGRSPPRF
jgi:hypothetical protein